MGVTLCLLRMQENLARSEANKLQLAKNSRELRQLSNFSSAVADGQITPEEIASVGSDLFHQALIVMDASNQAALEYAEQQTAQYADVFSDLTANEYFHNAAYSQYNLYFDEDGNFDEMQTGTKLYEQALQDYVQKAIMPVIHEREEELQQEKTRLETEIQQLEAEYDSLKEAKSQAIQRETIQLH